MASYSCNQFMAPNEGVYTVACERGTVRVEVHNGTCAWMDSPGGDWRIETFELPARDDPFMWQATHFMDFIEGKGGPACSLEEGIQTLQVNLAALDAAEKQVWVEL